MFSAMVLSVRAPSLYEIILCRGYGLLLLTATETLKKKKVIYT